MNTSNTEPENIQQFNCSKCHNTSYETGTIRTTGGGFSRFFDVQNQKFSHITCDNCGYTEFFKRKGSRAGNILDMFIGR